MKGTTVKIQNTPEPVDTALAIRLLLHTSPAIGLDITGINTALSEVEQSGRVTQLVMALTEMCHCNAPILNTPEGIAAMRRTLAQYENGITSVEELNEKENNNDD